MQKTETLLAFASSNEFVETVSVRTDNFSNMTSAKID